MPDDCFNLIKTPAAAKQFGYIRMDISFTAFAAAGAI